jgi:hypothetical protein
VSDPTARGKRPPSLGKGFLERLLAAAARGPVGWVFQGYPDERLVRALVPGRIVHWDDARSQGKAEGQPVLFLQTGGATPTWVAWGRVIEPEERWRVFGVGVRCHDVLQPGLPALGHGTPRPSARPSGGQREAHVWEFPELGRALGLERSRERTPYLDTGARDLRLGVQDLAFLLELQPSLRLLGSAQGAEETES